MARGRGRGRSRASSTKVGLEPGTPIYTGHAADVAVRARVMDYGPDGLDERETLSIAELAPYRDTPSVSWIDVVGLHDVAVVQSLCEQFGVHPLAVEDVLSVGSLPKADDYDGTVFVQLKMLETEERQGRPCIVEDHVSFVLGPTWLITFQERPGDVWDPVRRRVRAGTGRLHKYGADYLLHSLLDAVVDGYFLVLARIEERVDDIEAAALDPKGAPVLRDVHGLRAELLLLRRTVGPLRTALVELTRDANTRISPAVRPYFRDLLDHVVRVAEGVEVCRERLAGVLDLHLAMTSTQTNEVMRVLTLVTSVFIPLTFIAGVYGMNFDYMPELRWSWGYPAVMAMMAAIAASLLGWMRYRSWL